MSELTDTLDEAGDIAVASTKALGRTLLFTTVPLIEFGVIILFAVAVVRLPLMILMRGEE